MCPLKREQAKRVSYNTLTHSGLYCRDREKSRSWIKWMWIWLRWWCVQISDNVGVEAGQVTRWPQSDRKFTADTTSSVTYTATDRAGLQSSCTFNVQVIRQSGQWSDSYQFTPCFIYRPTDQQIWTRWKTVNIRIAVENRNKLRWYQECQSV